jgi:hypothetical protein
MEKKSNLRVALQRTQASHHRMSSLCLNYILFSLRDISSDGNGPPVVVNVHPKQSFWLESESFPMHYARSHPKEEVDFLMALVYSAHGKARCSYQMCDWGNDYCLEHISGQGYAMGRFNYLEYRRAIDLFLQLKGL